MSFSQMAVLFLVALILWTGRRLPITGWRRMAATACRLAVIATVGLALWGGPRRRIEQVPRRVVYLADVSASMDAAQREWMARRIASVEAVRPPSMERAVMAFGAQTEVLVPFGRERLTDPRAVQGLLDRASVARDATHMERALLGALALLPAEHRGGIVLLSDGRETAGNITGLLPFLKRADLETFPVPPPVSAKVTTIWDALVVPPVVQRGAPVPIQLVVFNAATRSQAGQVTLALEGVTVKRQRVTVRPGWSVVTVSLPALASGTMGLGVQLTIPDAGLSEQRSVYTEVEGPPQVLLVAEQVSAMPLLGTALKRREIDVAVTSVADLPTAPQDLSLYDAVLLFNVPKTAVTELQAQALRAYVEQSGGGVVMVGLGGDLSTEIQARTPLDELLPVQFEPKGLQESKRRVCMVMLIDRSASMIGPRIAATKKAAVALVKQLAPEDLVGILAFDTQAYVISEVQPAGQLGPRLIETLVKLRSSGGTDIYPALTAAENRLELTGATVKHIILLSDGNTPFHEQAYRGLVELFRREGITVSTIGIGSSFIDVDFLTWLARSTGGAFYQMRSLEELPKLVARDTESALGRLPFSEGEFRPTKTPTTDWFAEVAEWPSLRGYLTATAKPGARVDLTINGGEGDDPLLARWTLGRGRVAAFASDADTRWSPSWIRWDGFEAAWGQIVRWALRPRLTEELFVWVDQQQGRPQLTLEGALTSPAAQVRSSDGAISAPLSLIQTGTWRWHASLEHLPSGWYQILIESYPEGAEGASVFAKRWVQVGTPPVPQELAGQPPQETLLRQIAGATGGVYDAPDRALVPPTEAVSVAMPMLTWWLPLMLVLLLIDIALRGPSML